MRGDHHERVTLIFTLPPPTLSWRGAFHNFSAIFDYTYFQYKLC